MTLEAGQTLDYSASRYKPAVITLNLFECVVPQFINLSNYRRRRTAFLLISDPQSSFL